MARKRHTGATTLWGTRIPATDSCQYGILDLDGRKRPVRLGADAANLPFPGINDSRTAKQLTKLGHVQCVFPGCGPYKTTAHNPERRDGFRHASGQSRLHGESGPETLDHLNSKAALLNWILDTYAEYVIDHVLDTKNIRASIEGRNASIRPDAYVELRSGAKIAIEFQHSAGDPGRILEKHAAYKKLGITTWWIFSGRSPFTCKEAEQLSPKRNWYRATLNSAQQHLVNRQIPFFWYDNERSLIATPTVSSRVLIKPTFNNEHWNTKSPKTDSSHRRYPFPGYLSPVLFHPEPLGECELDVRTGVLITPTVRVHRTAQSGITKEIATLRQLAERRHVARQHVETVRKRIDLAARVQQSWANSIRVSYSNEPKLGSFEDGNDGNSVISNLDSRELVPSPLLDPPSSYPAPKGQGIFRRIGSWFASLVQ